MRKLLLFALITALSCNVLFAQDSEEYDRPNRIAVGPKIGLGIGMGSHSNVQGIDFKTGFGYQLGGAINAHFGRRYASSDGGTGWFGVEVEAMFDSRAIKLGSSNLRTNCLVVPVLAQVYVVPSVALEAGATMVKVLGTTPKQITYDGATYNVGEIHGSDVMITAGVCYKNPTGIMIDARYNIGTSPLAGNLDTKVSSLMVSFAYLFNILK